MSGEEKLILTGQLGSVMKESAMAALSFIRSNNEELGISEAAFVKRVFHIHVPAGATPKDGPSAGITMVVSLASLLSNRPIKPMMAMTGEITLRGQLLPIGGLKEKLLASYRAGVTTVVLPEGNRKDTIDLPAEIKNNISFKFFDEVLPVIRYALDKEAVKKPGKKSTATRKKTKKK